MKKKKGNLSRILFNFTCQISENETFWYQPPVLTFSHTINRPVVIECHCRLENSFKTNLFLEQTDRLGKSGKLNKLGVWNKSG